MNNNHIGKICPHCGSALTAEDTIVFCNVCGAPHHLSCWQANQGCAVPGCNGCDAVQSEKPIEVLWESSDMVFQTGVPMVLENTALILDRVQDKLFARCTFRAVTDKPIRAALIEISCQDVWGTPLGEPVQFQYLDLRTRRESRFGQTQPIELADKNIRRICVSVRKVLFADHTAVDSTGAVFTMPAPTLLEQHFGSPELAAAYAAETAPGARFMPVFADGFWRCACGCLNTGAEETCHHCGCTGARLTAALDPDLLQAKLAQQRAEAEAAQQEQQLARSKKRRKTAVIALLLALVLGAAAACGILFYGVPYLRYTDACALLESGAYDDARQVFLALGTFRDSAEMAKEAVYQQGLAKMEEQDYAAAKEIFEGLGTYSDSADRVKEAAYQQGLAEMAEQDYMTAMEIFEGLGSYSDSADRALEAKYLKAGVYLDDKDYYLAYELYRDLGSYQDSQDKLLTTMLLWEAEALGSSVNAEAIRFVQTVTLKPEHYELYYNTILLYLSIQDDLQPWHDAGFSYACAKVSSMLRLLPATYQDTSALLELFDWLASDNDLFYDLFLEKEDLLRELWGLTFVQALAGDDWFITAFMEGYWTTYSGDYYLHFYEEEEDVMHCSYNLPWVEQPAGTKYYDIKDQTYIFIDEDYNQLAKVYRFDIIDYDTIQVLCYKNNRTYTLYR